MKTRILVAFIALSTTATARAQEPALESETPGLGRSSADALAEFTEEGIRTQHQAAVAGVGQNLAEGRTDAGETLAKARQNAGGYASSAGQHARDSVVKVPEKAQATGKVLADGAHHAAQDRRDAAGRSAAAFHRLGATLREAHDEMQADQALVLAEDAEQRDAILGRNHQRWARADASQGTRLAGIQSWTAQEAGAAWWGLTAGAQENVARVGTNTRDTAVAGGTQTGRSVDATGALAARSWSGTRESTEASWSATRRDGNAAYQRHAGTAEMVHSWVVHARSVPWRETGRAVDQWTAYNKEKGVEKGWDAARVEAGKAWDNDDRTMAAMWMSSGAAKCALHMVLLQPLVTPALLGSGAVATVGLYVLGNPAWVLLHAAGAGWFAAIHLLGGGVTGLLAVGGTLLTGLAAGAGVARVVATAILASVATVAVALGSAGLVVVGLAGSTLRGLLAPGLGVLGAVATLTLGTAERAVLLATLGGALAARQLLTLAGMGFPALAWLGHAGLGTTGALLVTLGEHLVGVPLADLRNGGVTLANGLATWLSDPVHALGDGTAAGLETVAGITVAALQLTGGAVRATAEGAGHGTLTLGMLGLAPAALVAKTGEFTLSALNIPQHRAWARFRQPEADRVVAAAAEGGAQANPVILVRVNWWGADTGRVRFFVTRDPQTGERWFYRRSVDPQTCEVTYQRTRKDPLARAFTADAWEGTVGSSVFHRGCMEQRGLLPQEDSGDVQDAAGDPTPDAATP